MGSFNTICFASKQVIKPNDKVCLLPIRCHTGENKVTLTKDDKQFATANTIRSVSYPTTFWTYAGPILEGTYNDYGKFLLTNTEENIIHIKKFFNILLESSYIADAKAYSCDHNFNMSEFYSSKEEYTFEELAYVWELVQAAITNEMLYVDSTCSGTPCLMKLAVMTQHTKDVLCDITTTSWKTWYYGKSYAQHSLDQIAETIKYYDELGFSSNSEQFKSWVTKDISSMFMQLESCSLHGFYDLVLKSWDLLPDDTYLFTTGVGLYNMVLVEHGMITYALTELGIKLEPVSYHNQNSNNKSGTKYLEMISAVNSKIKKDLKTQS